MGFLGPMEGAGGWLVACGCAVCYILAGLWVLRAIMALSGFGQSPANRGRANASHKAKPEALTAHIFQIQYFLANAGGI